MDKIKRIKELVEICNYHCNLYYNLDQPEITDKQYDQLFQELENLEKETSFILSSSPTQKVQGEVLSCFKEIKHTEPILSADKSKNINDIIKFMGNQECDLSWKLDGVDIIIRYNNGKFQQALTRGNGSESGEDVSHTVKTFINLPINIEYKKYLEIRGQGLITFREFKRINNELLKNGEKTYSNPRNLASGSTRQLDANITKSRNLIFIAFGIIKCENELWKSKYAQLSWLEDQGFEVVEHQTVNKDNVEKWIEIFKNKVSDLPYLTDGLIVEYDDTVYGKAQGSTGHHSKALCAFKWNDDNYETKFTGIELNTCRSGIVSITGLFQTIEIDGSKVSRATLHNLDIFESLQLGIGDIITVYKANSVIPQIEENLTKSNTFKIEMKCPSCGNDLIIKQPKDARFLYCDNENCPSRLIDKMVHFCSKNGMDIEGLSEQRLEKFINKGLIKTFGDIYLLFQHEKEIVNMTGFGKKSFEKLINSIYDSRKVKFENFIYAFGIPQLGIGGSKRLAKHFNNDIKLFLACCINYDYTQIEDFGITIDEILNQYFSNVDNVNQFSEVLEFVTVIKPEENKSSVKILAGKTFVITGDVQKFKNRKEIQEKIESLGGQCTGSVSKNTSYLINNDVTSDSNKNKDAKKLGIPIISEDEFIKMIEREVN